MTADAKHGDGEAMNRRALLSVSDKRGLVPFAKGLADLGWELISTGGTARVIQEAGIPVIPVEAVTGMPEMLDGRVKTLHPKVHGGILARPDLARDREVLGEHGITPIAMVAVNLYPFRETVANPRVKFEDAVEQIDIGGPAMLRSAAKNHRHVIPVVDPQDYPRLLEALRKGAVDEDLRCELAGKVFAHTAAYDAAIAAYLSRQEGRWPAMLTLVLERGEVLRYGENPQQTASLYYSDEPDGIRDRAQRQGKELSFNNLLDMDAAVLALSAWPRRPACVIIKHTTPCGLAVGGTALDAYQRALATDPLSAFGGVVAFNTVVDEVTAQAMAHQFVEVVVAPAFHAEALATFKAKKNMRVIELPLHEDRGLDFKRIRGGMLVQERFNVQLVSDGWKVPTKRQPAEQEWLDLRFAWGAVAAVKSNAILLARDEAAIGIGAGQMSRVDAVELALKKCRAHEHDPAGSVLASDAFFPFRDGVDAAAAAGVTAIIQPGGSVRDEEVIAAADELGLAMVLTGTRQFRH